MSTPPEQSTWFLDESSLLESLRDARVAERTTNSIELPGYEIVGEIARGGQGVVLMARQRATRRTVAIKVLHDSGFASPQARRRFERETEIVATLDHPGIVKVFDAGVTSGGQPYIVMEQVDGVPLDRFAASRDRQPREVARLVADVCDALDAAHRRGVIHRDVKPGNVLVDASGRPRLLDFGLARTGDARPSLSGPTMTQSGQFLGSLPWASPEQASGDPARIEQRSDIYSVGVLLHQALTGTFPYGVDGSLATVLHAIEQAEPQRPSAVRRELPRELDAIVLMALAKRPGERYATAAEMAEDLRAFLDGGPLKARRESAAVAMARLVRRYRRVAVTSSLVALGFLVLSVYALRLSNEAQRQRARSERRFDQVRSIASTLLFDVHAAISKLEGSREARELIVTAALGYLRDLAPDANDHAAFTAELATAWERVGDIQGNPLVPNLGQTAEAMGSYRESIALREGLVERDPNDAAACVALAGAHGALGFVQLYGGSAEDALASFAEGERTLARLVGEAAGRSDAVGTHVMLLDRASDALALVGKTDESIAKLAAAAALLGDDSPLASDHVSLAMKRGVIEGKLAITLWEAKRPAEALPHSREAVRLQREVQGASASAAHRRELSVELNTLASILIDVGQLDDARSAVDEALGIRRRALDVDPNDAQARSDIAYTLIRQAGLLAKMNDTAGVCAAMDEAITARTALAERTPKDGALRRGVAVARAILGELCGELAVGEGLADGERSRMRSRAAQEFDQAAALLEAMAAEGLLMPSDAQLPAQLRSRAEALRAK
jgi:tetratricopeptide (TPR) repeat protein/predicted Ser/Thr protein kinase